MVMLVTCTHDMQNTSEAHNAVHTCNRSQSPHPSAPHEGVKEFLVKIIIADKRCKGMLQTPCWNVLVCSEPAAQSRGKADVTPVRTLLPGHILSQLHQELFHSLTPWCFIQKQEGTD